MFGVTLRFFALYFGVAALLLFLARRLAGSLRAGSALFLILAPLLFTGQAARTGGILAPIDIAYNADPLLAQREAMGLGPTRNPVLSDVVYQTIPWQKAVRKALSDGRLPLWNRFLLAGEPLLAVPLHGSLHPTFWLGLILPLPQAWTLSMTLRLLLALWCGYLFFRDLGGSETASLFGASAWAFCDFLMFFLGYQQNLSVSPIPLLLLGLRRLARAPGRQAAAITLGALLLMTTAGHPETMMHAVAGTGVYFLFELFWSTRGSVGRSVGLALVCGVLALGLSAPLFLPFREALLQSDGYRMRVQVYARSERSAPLAVSLKRSLKNAVPYAFGSPQSGQERPEFAGAAGYAGALLLPLAVVGLLSSKREKWPLLLAGGLGLAAWARFPVVNDVICRLPLFDLAINEYMAAWGAFAVCALATFGLEDFAAGRRRVLVAAASCGALIGILLVYRQALPDLAALSASRRAALVLMQAVPLGILGLSALAVSGRRARKALPGLLLAVLIAERYLEMGSFYPTMPARAFYPPLPVFDRIPRGEPWRMAALGTMFIPNIAALYDLEDARGYDAMTLAPLVDTFPLWCAPQPVWYNRIDDPTKPFLSFLNVRYVLAPNRFEPPAGWSVLAEGAGGRLLENPAALPRVFVPRRLVREPDAGRRIERLAGIRDFAAEGVVSAPAAPASDNGAAEVRIQSYAAQRMEISIDARQSALIATSVTGWAGWRLSVDGQDSSLLSYNHAFLAFQVPPGRHLAVLRYWPRSFVTGLWVSGLALLSTIAFFAWPRRRLARFRDARA